MFNSTMPLPIFFLFVIMLIVFFAKNLPKKKKPILKEDPFVPPVVDHSVLPRLIDKHKGWKMAKLEMFVFSHESAKRTFRLAPGDQVRLKLVDGSVHVFAKGCDLGMFYQPTGDRFNKDILSSGAAYEAFLGDRIEFSGPEFITDTVLIVVFWPKYNDQPV